MVNTQFYLTLVLNICNVKSKMEMRMEMEMAMVMI